MIPWCCRGGGESSAPLGLGNVPCEVVHKAAKKALDHGRESDGATPLMLAMEIGDEEAVR